LNDHLHEKRLEKDFLIGIRQDLRITADKLDADRLTFQHTLDYYDTIWKQIQENRIDKSYMDRASGNLRLIENQSLRLDITRMFTVTLPDREVSDRIIFQERRNQYITYIGAKTPIGANSNSQISGVLNDPAIRFQVMWQGALLVCSCL